MRIENNISIAVPLCVGIDYMIKRAKLGDNIIPCYLGKILLSNTYNTYIKRYIINYLHKKYPSLIYDDEKMLKIYIKMYEDDIIEANHIIGFRRFSGDKKCFRENVLTKSKLAKIVYDPQFWNHHVREMCGEDITDVNIRDVFRYNSHLVTARIINYIVDRVSSNDYSGRLRVNDVLNYAEKHCPKAFNADKTLVLMKEIQS